MLIPPLQRSCQAPLESSKPAVLERLWRNSGDCYLEHHPDWARLNARSTGARSHTFAASKSGEIASYVFIREGPGALNWMLGEVCLHNKPVERLHIIGGQVFADDLGSEERHDQANEHLAWLAREARGRSVFLHQLQPGSPLAQLRRSYLSAIF